jgi:hypothetical protein
MLPSPSPAGRSSRPFSRPPRCSARTKAGSSCSIAAGPIRTARSRWTRSPVRSRRPGDPYGTQPLDSLTGPLKAAGKRAELVEFEGDSAAAKTALEKALGRGDDVAIVLADEAEGLYAAYRTLRERRESNHPDYLFGGYMAYDYRSGRDFPRQATAFGDRGAESIAVKAFQAVRSLIEGKPVNDRIEVPIVVHKKTTLFVPTPPPALAH